MEKMRIVSTMSDMYGERENSINNVLCKVFRKELLATEFLPPTQDAMYLRLKRANKGAYEWTTELGLTLEPTESCRTWFRNRWEWKY